MEVIIAICKHSHGCIYVSELEYDDLVNFMILLTIFFLRFRKK